jgi:hypothetical protein
VIAVIPDVTDRKDWERATPGCARTVESRTVDAVRRLICAMSNLSPYQESRPDGCAPQKELR